MSTATRHDPRVTLHLETAAGPGGRWPEPTERGRNYYTATLVYRGRRAAFSFNTGSGWKRPPVAREVLECVLADAAMVRGAATADEAARMLVDEFGDDAYPNADEARKLGAAMVSNARKVEKLFGDAYAEALDDPEAFCWAVTDDPPASLERQAATFSPMVRRFEGRIGSGAEGPFRLEAELRATERGLELGLMGSTPHTGGQNVGELVGLTSFEPGWDAERVARLREVWERWHLNGMRSACEHQRALGWTYATHAGQDCPECGYRIGSAWLFEPLPADVVEFVEMIVGPLDTVRTFQFYTGADKCSRFALEASYPDVVGTVEHDQEAADDA